jgi:hypothetical protein
MASRKFVNSVVLHTPTGFFVANAGESKEIPDDLVDRATAAGAFGKEAAADAVAASGPEDATDKFKDAGAFRVVVAPGVGNYAITGPGVPHPETFKGKAATQERLDALNKDLGGGSGEAPTD